jgi:rare lipoprotein A
MTAALRSTRRTRATAAAALVAACALLAAPAARADDGDGGASAGGVAAPPTAPIAQAVTASGAGFSVTALPDAMLGTVARFRGGGSAASAGRLVRVQELDGATQRWTSLASARVATDGSFIVRWRPAHIGRFALRAVLAGATAPLTVTVYKPTLATWYGPGFYGNLTACGIPLTPDLVGVAHRSLPCGTQVALTYAGRSIVVPVVDRGPFGVAGAEWDLTQAAAMALGISATTTLGAVHLRDPQPAAASK